MWRNNGGCFFLHEHRRAAIPIRFYLRQHLASQGGDELELLQSYLTNQDFFHLWQKRGRELWEKSSYPLTHSIADPSPAVPLAPHQPTPLVPPPVVLLSSSSPSFSYLGCRIVVSSSNEEEVSGGGVGGGGE